MAEQSTGMMHEDPDATGEGVPWTPSGVAPSFKGNPGALAEALAGRIRGEVRFDGSSKAIYSTDASNYRQVPVGVVIPRDVEDMIETVAVCREHEAPVTHRGAGTSLAGQCVNAAVVVDCSKYLDEIVEIDPEERTARVQPGVRHDQLSRLTVSEHDLNFGPDTSTHEYATFGGMIGNNSCGVHSQMAGRTEDNVEELDILTYDGARMRVGPTSEEELDRIVREGGRKGEIYGRLRELRDRYGDQIRERTPDIPRRVSGYNLVELLPENDFNVARALVGTEGTCVTILEATVKLVHSPPHRSLLVLGYPDVFSACEDVEEINRTDAIGLEGIDHGLVSDMRKKQFHDQYLPLLPEGDGFLFVEFGGETQEEAHESARRCAEMFRDRSGGPSVELIDDPGRQSRLWEVRESGLGATAHVEGETWPGWEDSAVPPEHLADYMRELRELYARYDYEGDLYGHFGQGCVHTRINFDLRSHEGVAEYRRFVDEASDLCARYGGSLSAEHGDGQARAEMLPKMYGEELVQAFGEFKKIWDPNGKMNPGKVVDPRRIDENLRLGEDYRPQTPDTEFAFPEDDGSFGKAALRCVGIGRCRRREVDGDEVMCPSFLATHEEKHTTRGRARLLFEMLVGEETPAAWQNEDVFEALDLCLACKGCKDDCPVSVDMATYKAEFLSHYYEGRFRPRHAYAFGLIYWWARLAAKMPTLVNFATQTPGLEKVVKWIGGMAQQRKVPSFPSRTFRAWFEERSTRNEGAPPVLLFPDTFHNFLEPETAGAAVTVLEEAGYQVRIPDRTLCCGRPLYDYGWIDPAKRLWRQQLDALRETYRAGTPIVGLEPSCVAAFRDELTNLFPHDEDARRLSETVFTLGEFLTEEADDYRPPELDREALVHGHCHHKSIMGAEPEKELLRETGLKFEGFVPASCCGMAGSFGFEAEHYEVSIQAGEHELLPAVREAPAETLLVADGFSCREQIVQTTDRRALHLAEVLHLARRGDGEVRPYPEKYYAEELRPSFGENGSSRTSWRSAGLAAAGALVGAAVFGALWNR